MSNRKLNSTGLLLLLLFQLIICHAQNVESELEKGSNLILEKRFDEAILVFTKIIKNNPTHYKAYLLRSQAEYAVKDYQNCINDCLFLEKNAKKLSKEDIYTTYWNLGTCFNSLNKFQIAIKYLKSAQKINENNFKIYENLGYSYLQLNQLDSALSEFLILQEIVPSYPKGYYGSGKVKLLREEYKEAIKDFDKAIELDENYAMAYQNRGSAKASIGDISGCCSDWKISYQLGIEEIKPFIDEYCK